jgi:hypothetical protein
MIGGRRITSADLVPAVVEPPVVLTGINKAIVEAIPYWPRQISIPELSARVHVEPKSLVRRLPACQAVALICQDGGDLCKLREDLSNV